MELLLSFLVGLLLGGVAAFFAFNKLTENNRKFFDILKGDSKTKGVWGEMVLERMLEVSGLHKGVHYVCQQSYKSNEGELLRPDVVIYLPNNRHIIIDSKVFPDKNSAREHVKILKNRFYEQIRDLNPPDFVIMFVPIESVFADIMRNDTDMFEFAWKNKVLVVGPSTLLATLKTIELSWQRENQTRNVAEIAEESGKLYDKFVGFISDFDAVKARFEDMGKKLEGRGGLIQQAEKIKALGAKATKQVPERYLD